ncbi:hypothetical protein JN603_004285 [Salmonella enterica]|nr:hypothetical protein [Salmonella enterica]EHD9846043.1 hypothetical protein [Salmonella enterica]EHT9203671.1 hypothetical protein [Salmonella enterica]EIN2339190.1 hypothetical protein [Salmonella enterica]EIN2347921.1 hypothetical protein [Salmonella enterica]
MLQLNYVRDSITAALLAYSKSQRNQIVVMSEMAGASRKYLEKPVREIEINGKVVVVDAEPVSYHEGKKFKTSTLPVSPDIFRQASWRRAMYQLPEQYIAWLSYCYGDALSFDHQTILSVHIWNELQVYQKENGLPKMNSTTTKKLKILAWLAIQETKNFVNRGEYKYSQEELSGFCGISYDGWRQNHKERWEVLLSSCIQLDREALIHVDQLRKKSGCHRR